MEKGTEGMTCTLSSQRITLPPQCFKNWHLISVLLTNRFANSNEVPKIINTYAIANNLGQTIMCL